MTGIEPVGVAEIATRAGVEQITVRKWISRHAPDRSSTPFPPPRATVSGQDARDWAEVRQWLADTGRLVRTSHRDPDTGRWTITEEAEPDSPEDLGMHIRTALAGIPARLWDVEWVDGRWMLRLIQPQHGADLRTALRMEQTLRGAGLHCRPDPSTAAADLGHGRSVEVVA